MVPSGWRQERLGKVLEKIIDYRGKSVPKADSGIPLITARNVREGFLDFSSEEFIAESDYSSWMTKGLPQKGDILFTTEAPLGNACMFPFDKTYAVGQRTVTLRTNGKLFSSYLLYFILSEKGQHLIDVKSSGSTAKGIKTSELKKVDIVYPPLPEQKKIARILSTWDKAIETVDKLIENSQQQKKALMQQLLTGKKRLPGFSGEWESQTIQQLEKRGHISLGRGRVISKKDIANCPGDYPIYSSSVKNNGLFGCYGKYDFEEELISWSVDGGGNFFYRDKHKFSVTNVSGYMKIDRKELDCKFISYQLQFLHSRLSFDYQTKAHPSVIRKLYTLLLPSLDEQCAISSILWRSELAIKQLELVFVVLQREKQALMQQLLTGKRRVTIDDMDTATA